MAPACDSLVIVNSTTAFRIAAVFGFTAVALGAFGAHGLKLLLEANGTTATWETGALYHLVHSAVLLVVAGREPLSKWAWQLFALGMILFSGSLYIFAVTKLKWLVYITPIGGFCLIAGWIVLAFRGR